MITSGDKKWSDNNRGGSGRLRLDFTSTPSRWGVPSPLPTPPPLSPLPSPPRLLFYPSTGTLFFSETAGPDTAAIQLRVSILPATGPAGRCTARTRHSVKLVTWRRVITRVDRLAVRVPGLPLGCNAFRRTSSRLTRAIRFGDFHLIRVVHLAAVKSRYALGSRPSSPHLPGGSHVQGARVSAHACARVCMC